MKQQTMRHYLFTLALLLTLSVSAQNKKYITNIYDYKPAPGQFTNVMPQATAEDSKSDVLAKVANAICGYWDENAQKEVIARSMISLGSYGGYVIFGFDHPLVNVKGEYDMQILGNAISGSSEPGIVMVANDLNGPWYELAGSEYYNPRTQHDFSITYYKPDPNATPTPDPNNSFINDTSYVAWTCNSVDSITTGHVYRNTFHSQSYWPLWINDASITFEGTKLRCNAADVSGQGSYWVQYYFDWGYVDNRPDYKYNNGTPSKEQNIGFKLDWAVDSNGNPVELNQVKYIKVYNGLLQQCGWLGETSTEVAGAIDLHPDAIATAGTKGDVNNDNTVDVNDLNIVINLLLNNSSIIEADVTGDGVTDVADVNEIVNIMLN